MANSARTKFGRAARKANAVCHRDTNSVSAFRSCMSKEMKSNLRSEGFKVGKGRKGKRRKR